MGRAALALATTTEHAAASMATSTRVDDAGECEALGKSGAPAGLPVFPTDLRG